MARGTGQHRACPLAVCDGSGWILGPEDVARACECRERMVSRARSRGVASVIPAKSRGVSFDRPPVTQINEIVVRRVREFTDRIEENLDTGRGLWFFGGAGTGKTTLAMLVSRIALESGRSVAIYSLPKMLARIRRTYESQRSLVVTTNLDQADLEEQIGERVVSRLVEICGDPLPLFDDDRRLRVSAEVAGSLGDSSAGGGPVGSAGLGP